MGKTSKTSFCHSGSREFMEIVPMGVAICHLNNSLHKASMYGRRGLSSNVGNRSLLITASSSACARLCTCGKRTKARKKEYNDDTVLTVGVSKKEA
jgi:hypothetical protein